MKPLETIVHRQVVIDAPVEAVWRTMLESRLSRLHLMRESTMHPMQEGARFAWFDAEDKEDRVRLKGHVTVVAEPRRIALMVYDPKSKLPDVPGSYTSVDITLAEQEDGRTLVTVEQGDFARHAQPVRMAREAGNQWVEALIRLREIVQHEAAA